MTKRLGFSEVIRVLLRHGFLFVSQRGSHSKYRNAAGRIAIALPRLPLPAKPFTAHTSN